MEKPSEKELPTNPHPLQVRTDYGERINLKCNLGLPWLPKKFDVHQSFDAQHWAAYFLQTLRENPDVTLDHDLMVCWFANALMKGYDEHRFRSKEYKREIRRIMVPWWKRLFVPLAKFGH